MVTRISKWNKTWKSQLIHNQLNKHLNPLSLKLLTFRKLTRWKSHCHFSAGAGGSLHTCRSVNISFCLILGYSGRSLVQSPSKSNLKPPNCFLSNIQNHPRWTDEPMNLLWIGNIKLMAPWIPQVLSCSLQDVFNNSSSNSSNNSNRKVCTAMHPLSPSFSMETNIQLTSIVRCVWFI